MKKINFIFICLFMATGLFAQTEGTLDPSFGTNGKVITDFQQHDYAYAIALQPDGKIILGGYSTVPINPNTNYVFAMARYNSNGTLDNTFGTGGRDTFDIGFTTSFDETAWTMLLQPDGKIILAGNHFNSNNDFALVRFNADGSPDNTFGTGGIVMTDLGKQDVILCAALQNDGKIVVSGFSGLVPLQNDFALARYNTDGSLDNAFGTNGKVITDLGDREEGWSVKILNDGKILVGGFSGFDFAIARYNADGTLDNSFNGTGKVTTDFVGNDCGRSIVIQNDGKYVLWGFNDSNYVYNFAAARYNTDGSLDNNFGTNGKAMTVCPGQTMAYSAALQSDGKFIVGGEMLDDFVVARFNTNGSIDNSFGTAGMTSVDFMGWSDQGFAIAIQPDYKILLGGNIHNGSNRDFALARFVATPASSVKDSDFSFNPILLYPNPVTDELTIEIPDNNTNINFEICNTIGQMVYKGNMISKIKVSTTSLVSGSYVIKFENGQKLDFKKLVKK